MIKRIIRTLIPVVLVFSLSLITLVPAFAATAPLTVSSQSPRKGTTGVSISYIPYINFSRAVDNTTVNDTNIVLMNGSTPVAADVTISGTRKAIITPQDHLSYSTTYYIAVSGVKDAAGVVMAGDYGSASTSQFTTAAVVLPTVSSQSPRKAATSVSTSIVPYVMFSKAMDASTITSTNILLMSGSTEVTATVSMPGTKKAIITPAAPLNELATYYIVVTTGARDTEGNSLASQYGSATASQFTTAAAKTPTVSSQYPTKGTTLVNINIEPYIVFSKAMDFTTINSTNIQLKTDNFTVPATIALKGNNMAVITPDAALDFNTVYYLTATIGVKDTGENALARGYGSVTTSQFTTGNSTQPTVSSCYPSDNSTGMPINIQPYIVFSRPMDTSTINSTNIQLMNGSTPVTAAVALSGSYKAVITPTSPVLNNTAYSIIINTTVKDTVGNALASQFITSFTTGDDIKPVFSSLYPPDNATDVPLGVQPCIVFSDAMSSATVNAATIKLMEDNTSIPATVALYGKNTAIIIPKTSLDDNTTYTMVVTTGIKDSIGNPLTSGSTTSFTTESPDMTVVLSQFPAENATGVSLEVQPYVVFSNALNSSTVNSTNIQLLKGTTKIAATTTLCGNNTVVIIPKSRLDWSTTYHIVVNTSLKDSNGNQLPSVYGSATASSFTTAQNIPEVISQFPLNSATEIPIDVEPCVVFSNQMDENTINSTNIQLFSGDDNVTVTVALSGTRTAVITPLYPLDRSTDYHIVVGTGVKDIDGNTMTGTYGSDSSSVFSTVALGSASSVLFHYPGDNATDVPIDVQPCIVFSQPMSYPTINTTNIKVLDGLTPVTAKITLYGKNTVIIIPSTTLSINKEYSINIGIGVKDAEGNAMESSSTSFTTVAE